MVEPLREFVFTDHAAFEMKRRGMSKAVVRRVVRAPEQRFEVRAGREVLQARLSMGEPAKTYLVRVFVDVERQPAEVVTAYRTSRIAKYWRQE